MQGLISLNRNRFHKLLIFRLDSRSVFMLDTGLQILILVGTNVPPSILQNVFGKLLSNYLFLLSALCYNDVHFIVVLINFETKPSTNSTL